jgi:hypothetical protein
MFVAVRSVSSQTQLYDLQGLYGSQNRAADIVTSRPCISSVPDFS